MWAAPKWSLPAAVGIYLSCLSAAESNDGKMIGVDVDQSNVSDRIITSAMKALSNSVVKALTDASANDWIWRKAMPVFASIWVLLTTAWACLRRPLSLLNSPREQYDTLFQAMADGSPGCGQQQQRRCEACHYQCDSGLSIICQP